MSDIEGKNAEAKVSIENPHGGIKEEVEEVIPMQKLDKDKGISNVGVSFGYTKNMGNYESMKIQVSLHVPCYVEEIDTIFDFAKEWVDEKMTSILEDVSEELES